jgi:hypothetical protein
MHQLCTHLTFISDPGHGWLRVPLADIAALGIETAVSTCSYIEGQFAYLEEDCDCAVYLDARTAHGLPRPDIQSQYVDNFDRSRPSFGDSQFTAKFWDSLRSGGTK